MSRKGFTPIIVVIIIGAVLIAGGAYLYFHKTTKMSEQPTLTASSTNTQPVLSFRGFLQGETALSKSQAFTSTSSNEVVSMQIAKGPQSINPTVDVLVNGKLAEAAYPTGEPSEPVVGMAIAMSTFSPNNKYFAFRSRVDQGAGSYSHEMYVVDLSRSRVFSLHLPVVKEADTANHGKYQTIDSFVQSYAWGSSNDIQVVMYAVGSNQTGAYRITPTETWDYNLTTGSSTLINATP